MTDFRSLFERQAASARSLADDLEYLVLNGAPSPSDLAAAPLISHWTMVGRPENALSGLVDFHPTIGFNRPIVTSSLFAVDPIQHVGGSPTWARVWSRWYRLGKPSGGDGRH